MNTFTGSLPKNIKDNFIQWEFVWDGFSIDLALYDHLGAQLAAELDVYRQIRANPNLRSSYEELKYRMNGSRFVAYKTEKCFFFNRILEGDD